MTGCHRLSQCMGVLAAMLWYRLPDFIPQADRLINSSRRLALPPPSSPETLEHKLQQSLLRTYLTVPGHVHSTFAHYLKNAQYLIPCTVGSKTTETLNVQYLSLIYAPYFVMEARILISVLRRWVALWLQISPA